jgi:DNA-binding NtrC family response regulator
MPAPIDARLLIVDDDTDILQAARLLLQRHFSHVTIMDRPEGIADATRAGAYDLLLLDMNFTPGRDDGAEGLARLEEVMGIDPAASVIIITAHSEVDIAVEAMKRGATDFVTKPWANARLIATLGAALDGRQGRLARAGLRQRPAGNDQAASGMLGTSPAMCKVLSDIGRAAPTDADVLILGENGTGKELAAREIHRQSKRADEVFIRVDLGTLSSNLFESELFGHRRGAFTDARQDRTGFLRAAAGGTLFLDEIGNVPLHLQGKLLTALERREVVPVGGERPEPIDVRLICATNLARRQLLSEECFRQDLLYRINTVELALPPLRERVEDIPLLLGHYAEEYFRKYNLPAKPFSAAAMALLTGWHWPGNIRALRHAVERAVILSHGDVFEPADFPLGAADAPPPAQECVATLGVLEKTAVVQMLDRHNHNISRAASALGLTRTSLYRRMRKYGL